MHHVPGPSFPHCQANLLCLSSGRFGDPCLALDTALPLYTQHLFLSPETRFAIHFLPAILISAPLADWNGTDKASKGGGYNATSR